MIMFMLMLTVIGCILLGLLVLSRDHRSLVNILAASINSSVAVWAVAILVFLNTDNLIVATLSAKTYYIASAIFVALLVFFSISFPDGGRPAFRHKITIGLSSTVMVLLLLLIPSFITTDIVLVPGGHNYILVDHFSYYIFILYFISLFSIGFVIMLRKFTILRKQARSQAGSYLIGIVVMSVPGLVTNLYLPFFGIYDYIWICPAAASVFVGSVTYGIVRHGMFDIRSASVRTLVYMLSLGTLAVLYVGSVSWLSLILIGFSYDLKQQVINISLAFVLVILFQPVKYFFDKITKEIFYKDSYSTDDFFSRLNSTLSDTTDLRSLLELSAREVGRTLKSEQAFFFINTFDGHYISAGTVNHKHLPKKDATTLESVYSKKQEVVVASLLDSDDPIRRLMLSHRIEIILPLARSGKFIGHLCLGGHLTLGYTDRDMKVLNTISDELGIAIQNALAVLEIRELNSSLQQRIENATKELRSSNATLRHLDKAKDEFVSMASHQLRTPLTSIKGYISMMLEGDAGEINDTQKHFLDEAFMSSERMVHLINDFLNVSRIQTGKFIIDKHPVDLSKVVGQEVSSLQESAISRNLTLIYNPPNNFPQMDIDESKIRQVIMNFVDNALYYSHPNTEINVSLVIDGSDVLFTVKDTGIGVPPEEQDQLFTKFYRASNARKQRPDGTGVGLYLAKKVIDAHDGKVIFESSVGNGSTFGFRLPL
jgi:signal transduction histidine kinase